MAFSTQREFINIGFINAEPDKPLKKRSDAAIKNIESVTDARAWSLDKHDRSRFLAEIVQETRSPPVTVGIEMFYVKYDLINFDEFLVGR